MMMIDSSQSIGSCSAMNVNSHVKPFTQHIIIKVMAVPRINPPSLTRKMTNKKLFFWSGSLVGAIVLVVVFYRMGFSAGFQRGQQEARLAADEYWISDSYDRLVVPIDFAALGDGWFFPKPMTGTCDSVHLCQVGAGGFFCRCSNDQLCAFDRDSVHCEDHTQK